MPVTVITSNQILVHPKQSKHNQKNEIHPNNFSSEIISNKINSKHSKLYLQQLEERQENGTKFTNGNSCF